MLTNRRTCPASSRKCLLMAGNRCSISPSKSGSVSELHSIVCTPSVNRRSAVGISTVIFISIIFPGRRNLISRDSHHTIVYERLKDRESRLDRRGKCVFLRNRVNRFQPIAGNACDRRVAWIDVSLLQQFLSDADGYASSRLRKNALGFREQLN